MTNTEEIDETALVSAAQRGDRAACELLVKTYERTVAATIIGMLGPGHDAEDAGQETMVKFLRSLKTFKGDASLRTYVTRIAMNTALDALRKRKRTLGRFVQIADDNPDEALETPSGHADQADIFEQREIVHKALGALKPEFRSVAVLRLMHGYSTEETASILNIPVGTVLSRLSRAKHQLFASLKEHFNDA